jgi:hypothetical protein
MSPYFWTQIPGLPLFASTVRNLGTLIIFTSNIMRRATLRSLNAAFKAQSSTPILSGRSVVRAGPSYASTAPRSVRYFHITPRSSQSISLSSTTTSYPSSHDKVEPVDTPYFVDNKFLTSSTKSYVDLHDPATNELVTRIPENTDAEMIAAVDSAEKAFKERSQTSVLKRQQIMFGFVQLIRENSERLAASCTIEQGKTLADARGDVLRGLQVAEAAVAAPEFLKGELLEVSKDMETRTYREPLGVVSAICPFSQCWLVKSQNKDANHAIRLSRHGALVVHPHRHHHRQHPDPQALRTGSRRRHDTDGTDPKIVELVMRYKLLGVSTFIYTQNSLCTYAGGLC